MEIGATLIISAIAGIAIPLMIQTAAIVWWASQMAARVRQAETTLAAISAERGPERLVKLETILTMIQKQQDEQLSFLRRLEGKLDKANP